MHGMISTDACRREREILIHLRLFAFDERIVQVRVLLHVRACVSVCVDNIEIDSKMHETKNDGKPTME